MEPDEGTSDFETIALPHLEAVSGFALSLTRDRAEADDLVQETFLRAFKGWHTFRVGSSVRNWLFTICRNTFIRMRRRKHRVVESQESDPDSMATVWSHVEAEREGLGDLFDRIDVRPAIERAIDALPEPHHSILVLVDLQEMSYEEAAEVLEVPIGTVRSRLFRARRMIQEDLIDHARDLGVVSPPEADAPGANR